MAASPPPTDHPGHAQKSRNGLDRLVYAFGFSLQGLQAGWQEKAFRLEACLAIVMIPLAFWLGQNWIEIALLTGAVVLILIVELLNTGIEAAIDRIGPEWHDLSKRAKDMGSAAVLLSVLLCVGIWAVPLYQRLVHVLVS
ncbi:diacylglycerol kinase [Diaphorobacter aerolatus]|uniref:Diacylglycerol kinase n=1 Tax=Diaphorobacter aerolatus TaxID=1288495 RepID=A0A7H0GLA5_9BURK|nr:diacylglycerol kinase [Diaphorobacter aerolatus]QNP49071.1 diacylglycerol kinase [Diaphorobacter aerolatus]